MTTEGDLLWQPSQEWINETNMADYMKWLKTEKKIDVKTYQELWEWSVNGPESFWASLWDYFDIQTSTAYEQVMSDDPMPATQWFPGARLNYAEHVFRNMKDDGEAIIHASELRVQDSMTWDELHRQTAAFANTLKQIGVEQGDRVVAYVSNIPEAVVAFLGCASIGAIWSSCSPEFGSRSVVDRFKQIEPKVMVTVDGYRFAGKDYDRMSVIREIQQAIPSLEHTIVVPYLKSQPNIKALKNAMFWDDMLATYASDTLSFTHVPFDQPLWILYSSGTTGIPKAIVQSQGGILLEHLKALTLHSDLKNDDRFFWYTTTGWMMWNLLVGGLLTGSSIVLYDGSPNDPDLNAMWQFVEDAGITVFGTSAGYLTACMKAGLEPGKTFDLSRLKSIGSTGSPLPPEGFSWVYENVKQDLALGSVSGGTDMCTAFILNCPILPVHAGELQCRGLGCAVEAYDDDGQSLFENIGELVITQPMPSMPIYFWHDPDGERYQDSYFDVYPGIWRHGDYIKITSRGSCVIYGRSDATINRGGVRMGTSEIYRVVEGLSEVTDSLIVDVKQSQGRSFMPLFVTLEDQTELDDALKGKIKQNIKDGCSPRHIPNEIYAVDDIPRTINGKKLEVPVKRILSGVPANKAANKGSMQNPEILDIFIQLAEQWQKEFKNA
ncbi:acetoacetate--CoA ligase [Tuberibacillus sp. Marseille-P3662]|uniref:acetoacetate--CoA ligase n=1 Tax=Tuberibacillus sp. Marseille-P3662 TaxID=1965358 RepID=UPI0020CB3F5B|nr:acetoacetate--CoA ligase [Tuberibacillus sp. Marseille-P3662]